MEIEKRSDWAFFVRNGTHLLRWGIKERERRHGAPLGLAASLLCPGVSVNSELPFATAGESQAHCLFTGSAASSVCGK